MKNLRKLSRLALVLMAGAPTLVQAQIPAVPVAPVAAVPVAPVAAAPPRNLWSFLCLSDAQKAACKAKFCGSQFGQLINNTLAPASAFTGGVIGQPCPGPNGLNPADLLLPPDSALGAAAKVKQDTAAAAARRAAIRYLSTTDCNWWPEAQAALANTLRADRNECVRLEAALALRRGCCCNRVTILALTRAVSVLPADGNPPEDSPRVRAAAMVALEHCLACYVSIVPAPVVPPPPPEQPLPTPRKEGPPPREVPPGKSPDLTPASQIQPLLRPVSASTADPAQNLSMEQVVQQARRVLQNAKQAQAAAVQVAGARSQSLSEVFQDAFHPSTTPGAPTDGSLRAAQPGSTIFGPPQRNSVPINQPSRPTSMAANAPRPFVVPPTVQATNPSNIPSAPLFSQPMLATPPASPTPLAQSAAWRPAPMNSSTAATPIYNRSPVPQTAAPVQTTEQTPVPRVIQTTEPAPVPVPAATSPTVSVNPVPATIPQAVSVARLLILLHDSTYPDVREYAATALAGQGEPTPPMVQALVSSASADASAEVRLACLKSLMKLQVNDPTLPSVVMRLQTDQDPRVRDAAKSLSTRLQ